MNELARAAGDGRLTFTEFEERCTEAQNAKTLAELSELTKDLRLPARRRSASDPAAWTSPPMRVAPRPQRSYRQKRWWVPAAVVGLLFAGLVNMFSEGRDSQDLSIGASSRESFDGSAPLSPFPEAVEGTPSGLEPVYLFNLSAVSAAADGQGGWEPGPASANGVAYPRSIYDEDVVERSAVEYELSRGYDRFAGTLGVGMGSPADSVLQFDVLVDGVRVASHRVGSADAVALDITVANASRLRFEVTRVAGAAPSAIIGDARLVPALPSP